MKNYFSIGDLLPLSLYEKNGLTVVLHFGKDSPRPDITVMVVSTMSKNSSPVKNVSFQAAVPKVILFPLNNYSELLSKAESFGLRKFSIVDSIPP